MLSTIDCRSLEMREFIVYNLNVRHRSRFAPPCRVSKVLAKDECWEKFNTKTCSVHASRQLTPDALKETFDRL